MNNYESLIELIDNSFACNDEADKLFDSWCKTIDACLEQFLKKRREPIGRAELERAISAIVQDTLWSAIAADNPNGFKFRLHFAEIVQRMPNAGGLLIKHLGCKKKGTPLLAHQKNMEINCSGYCTK